MTATVPASMAWASSRKGRALTSRRGRGAVSGVTHTIPRDGDDDEGDGPREQADRPVRYLTAEPLGQALNAEAEKDVDRARRDHEDEVDGAHSGASVQAPEAVGSAGWDVLGAPEFRRQVLHDHPKRWW